MTNGESAVLRGWVLVAVLALAVMASTAVWAQPNGNASNNIIPTLDIVGLIGLAAAVGGVGLLGLRARRQGRRKP